MLLKPAFHRWRFKIVRTVALKKDIKSDRYDRKLNVAIAISLSFSVTLDLAPVSIGSCKEAGNL